MVARDSAHVPVGELAPRPDHDDAAELPYVALNASLARAAAQRAQGVERQARGEGLHPASPQTGGPIRTKLGIDEQGRVEAVVLSEGLGEVHRPVSHHDQLGSVRSNLVHAFAQLRDLLAAEESAEVTDEDENHRSLLPQRPEAHLLAAPVRELDTREPCRQSHRSSSSIP
jgi:hypothetical protein